MEPVSLVVASPNVDHTRGPVQSGLPLPIGACRDVASLALQDDQGRAIPAQFEPMSRWADGSLRWVLINAQQAGESPSTNWQLVVDSPDATNPAPAVGVTVSETDNVFTVDTGRLRFDVPIYSRSLLQNIQTREAGASGGDANAWRTVSTRGLEAIAWRAGIKPFYSKIENLVVESEGPVKSVLRVEGHHLLWDTKGDDFDPAETPALAFVLRIFVWAGSPDIRLQYTFVNDHRDHHSRASERYHVYALEELRDFDWVNGQWVDRPRGIRFREQELLDDDYGQVPVKSIRLRLHLDEEQKSYAFGVKGDKPLVGEIDQPVALQQVGPRPHFDGFFKDLPFPHIPFRADVLHGRSQPAASIERAAGWAELHSDAGRMTFGGKYFWQYHPKMIACDAHTFDYVLWSKLEDLPDPEIGFAKTHECMFRFEAANSAGGSAAKHEAGDASSRDEIMAMLHAPLRAAVSPEYYISTGAFGEISAGDRQQFGHVDDYLLASCRNAATTREEGFLFGVRDFGDTQFIRFDTPIFHNQEYDILLGATLQYARTNDRDYLDEADVLAWHFMDVDVLHASNSPLNEYGQHMHFVDHAKGETHAGHGTVEGLWQYAMLTGEPRAREVAEGIGNFFAKIAAWKNFLDFRDDEERTIGWALRALVSSYEATGNPRYKLAAQMVIEQAVAGQDPDTGNWDHPLYPNEDASRPTHIGGKPWMVGIILSGVRKYRAMLIREGTPDPRVDAMITKAAEWILWSEYRYMTSPLVEAGQGDHFHVDALMLAWEVSGRRVFIDEATRIFFRHVGKWSADNAGKWTLRGTAVDPIATMIKHLTEHGEDLWRDGQPVIQPTTAGELKSLRADTRFQAKVQKRY